MNYRRILPLIACCWLGLAASAEAGGKVNYEDIIKQMVETMDSLSATLATVRDQETAKEAQPELRKAAAKWQLIYQKAKDVPPPDREEKDRVAKLYKMKLEEAQKKLFGEVGRVSVVPGGREALLEISGVLRKQSKE